MNKGQKLRHKTTGRVFTYESRFMPQFTLTWYVQLKNTKTGKFENFVEKTYLSYFEIIY